MALTDQQARELRSLLQSWTKASQRVAELLRGAAVSSDGLDMRALRSAIDERSQGEQLLVSFWTSVTAESR